MKTDRLRTLSFVIVAIAIMALVFDISSHNGQFALFTTTLVLLLTVLENIRREFRDLRREVQALAAKPNVLPNEPI